MKWDRITEVLLYLMALHKQYLVINAEVVV